jgi:hypothetical protein
MAIWQSVAVPAEQAWAWTLGPLTLYLRRSGDELVLAVARAEDPDAAAEI